MRIPCPYVQRRERFDALDTAGGLLEGQVKESKEADWNMLPRRSQTATRYIALELPVLPAPCAFGVDRSSNQAAVRRLSGTGTGSN